MATCSRCLGERNIEGQRYCRSCRAAYMRERRNQGVENYQALDLDAKKRAIARSIARIYDTRHKISVGKCESCGGSENIERHHDDYSKPTEVRYLCRKCHKSLHTGVKRAI